MLVERGFQVLVTNQPWKVQQCKMKSTKRAAMALPVELVVLAFLFCATVGVVDSDDGK